MEKSKGGTGCRSLAGEEDRGARGLGLGARRTAFAPQSERSSAAGWEGGALLGEGQPETAEAAVDVEAAAVALGEGGERRDVVDDAVREPRSGGVDLPGDGGGGDA